MVKTETVFLPGGGDQVPTLLDVVIGMHYIQCIPPPVWGKYGLISVKLVHLNCVCWSH